MKTNTRIRYLLLAAISLSLLIVGVLWAAETQMVVNDPPTMGIRKHYITAALDINTTVTPPVQGTEYIELISIRLHLSAVGGINNFVVKTDSILGAQFDTVLLTQDMTAVTDVYQTYAPGEAVFDSSDRLVCTYTNTNTRTYGLEVLYRLK